MWSLQKKIFPKRIVDIISKTCFAETSCTIVHKHLMHLFVVKIESLILGPFGPKQDFSRNYYPLLFKVDDILTPYKKPESFCVVPEKNAKQMDKGTS